MKRGLESNLYGLEQIVLFSVLILTGLLPTVRSVWGEDESTLPSSEKVAPTLTAAKNHGAYDVDQIHAQLRFLSVPSELVESTILDWTIAPFDPSQLAAADPFVLMSQPLLHHRVKSRAAPHGHVAAGTNTQIPTTHKILNDEEAQQLLSRLAGDERTKTVFRPQLAFLDGTTATAVAGQKTPFVVGWKDGLPQTRVISQGKMARLRTVLDGDTLWLDYEIILSRILDVTKRSIRVADRPLPVELVVPSVQTTKATASVEMPVGGTVLIGGLPDESDDGIPRQLLVLMHVSRMRQIQMKKSADNAVEETQAKASSVRDEPADLQRVPARSAIAPKKRNPFSLISRFFNRTPKQTSALLDSPDSEQVTGDDSKPLAPK